MSVPSVHDVFHRGSRYLTRWGGATRERRQRLPATYLQQDEGLCTACFMEQKLKVLASAAEVADVGHVQVVHYERDQIVG